MLEILASRTPAVIVPFAEGAESEQTDRARLLADEGPAAPAAGAESSMPHGSPPRSTARL